MPRIPIDFTDPDAELQAAQDYASRLPVELPVQPQGYTHTYQPGWDADLVAQAESERNPLVFAPAIHEGLTTAGQLISGEKPLASPSEMLGHVVGPNRLQTWPEQMVRSGGSLPADVYSGRIPVMQGEHTNPELIERTQDLAGMAGGGSVAGVGREATLGAGPIYKTMTNNFELLKNPNNTQLEGLLKKDKVSGVRGVVNPETNDVYVFNNMNYTHNDVIKELANEGVNVSGLGKNEFHIVPKKDGGYAFKTSDELKLTDKQAKNIISENPNLKRIFRNKEIEHIGAHNTDRFEEVLWNSLFSDTSSGAPLAALEHAPRFYSALEHAVNNSKTKVANADQWLGELRNQPGVKQEELDWVLHDLPQGKITKSELEQYVNEHKVELKEVNKSSDVTWENNKDDIIGVYNDVFDKPNASEDIIKKWFDKEKNNPDSDVLSALARTDQTRHSQWKLPGGDPGTYREMIMTLPENRPQSVRDYDSYQHELGAKYNKNPGLIDPGYNLNYLTREESIKLGQLAQKSAQDSIINPNFTHSHWPGIVNPVAHVRTEARTIPGVGKSLHIEEGQSDLHQAGRHQGYVGEKEKLQPQFDKIEQKILDSNDENVMANPEIKDALKTAVEKKIITADEARMYQRYSDINAQQQAGNKPVMDAPFKKDATVDLLLKRMIRQAAEEGKDSISWTPGQAQADRYDLSKQVRSIGYWPEGDKIRIEAMDHNGKTVINDAYAKEKLPDVIGKEMADKIISKQGRMEDEKHDVRMLEGLDLKIGGEFHKKLYDEVWVNKANAIAKKFGGKVEEGNIDKSKGKPTQYADFEAWKNAPDNEKQLIHVLRITPALRDAALNKGFSLFADTGKVGAPIAALTRVEHNPFKLGELEKQHNVKLTPVAENPFTSSGNYDSKPSQKDFVKMLSEQRDFEGYQAAIRDPETRKIHTGDWHAEVLNKVAKDRGVSVDELPTTLIKGFINNKGRFLTEQQVENLSRSKSAMFRASGVPLEVGHDQQDRLIPPPPNPARIAALEPPEKAIATIAVKASEWGLFALARNSPRLFASLTAAWGAQLPAMISQFMMDDIRKQVREGKSIADIKFEEGGLADLFGTFSSLEKKYGKAASKLRPISHNPFKEQNEQISASSR